MEESKRVAQKFISMKQASKMTNMSIPTVKKYAIECGAFHKIGRIVRIDKSVFVKYLHTKTTENTNTKNNKNTYFSWSKDDVTVMFDTEKNIYRLGIHPDNRTDECYVLLLSDSDLYKLKDKMWKVAENIMKAVDAIEKQYEKAVNE